MYIRKFRRTAAAVVIAAVTALGGVTAANAEGRPPAPENVRVTDLQANVATVSWDASPGADLYYINVSGDRYYPTQNTSDLSHELYLKQGFTYHVKVTARGPDGWSPQSEPVTITMPVDPDQPYVTTPTGLTAETVISESGVDLALSWNPSEGVGEPIRYVVEARHSYIRDTEGSDEPSVTFDARAGTDYTLRVKALDVVNRVSAWSEPLEFTTDELPPPSPPENVTVTPSEGAFTVTWDAASSDASIKDYEVTVAGDTSFTRTTTDRSASFDYAPGGDLNVTVKARDTDWQWGQSSSPVEFTLDPHSEWSPPTAPTNLRANFDERGFVGLVEWDASSGGVGDLTYTLYIGDIDFERTRGELSIDLDQYFSRCDQPGQPGMAFTVTASSDRVESPHSNPISLCF